MSKKRKDAMAIIDEISTLPTEDELLADEDEQKKHEEETVEAIIDAATGNTSPDDSESDSADEETSPVEKAVEIKDDITSTVSNTFNTVKNGLERVATPGSILLPVGILLLLYFLIIPVNGNSRIAWLWLVLTGNAQLPGAPTNPNGGVPVSPPTGTPPAGATPNNTFTPAPTSPASYGGNEDIE